MTEDEHIQLVKVGDKFWEAFGKLAAEHVAMMPEHLEFNTIMYLQDMCSIYGSQYSDHLQEIRSNP